jgi:hypothetical protein
MVETHLISTTGAMYITPCSEIGIIEESLETIFLIKKIQQTDVLYVCGIALK